MPVAWRTPSTGSGGCCAWFCLASVISTSVLWRSLLRAAASRVAALQVAKQSKGKSGTSCAICRWSVYLLVCNRCFPSCDHLWVASLSQPVVAVMLGNEWYLTPAQSSVPAYKLALQFQKSPITQSFISSANNSKIRLHNIFDTGFRNKTRKRGTAGTGWDPCNSISSPRGSQKRMLQREVQQKANLHHVRSAHHLQ